MNKKLFIVLGISLTLFSTSCKKQATEKAQTVSKTDSIATVSETNKVANSAAEILAKKQIPVLCYHRIDNVTKGDYTVTPSTFEAHMKVLSDSGYSSIQPAQLYDYLVYNASIPEKSVLITFDDSRIEHYQIAAPVMEKYGFKGSFFIMTITLNKKNYMNVEQIADLASRGHEIGLHSWDHTMATKYKEEKDWTDNVINPREKLSQISKKPVEYWAYPNGVFNTESAQKLEEHFKISFILSQKRDSVYPLQTVRRVIVADISTNSLLKSIKRNF